MPRASRLTRPIARSPRSKAAFPRSRRLSAHRPQPGLPAHGSSSMRAYPASSSSPWPAPCARRQGFEALVEHLLSGDAEALMTPSVDAAAGLAGSVLESGRDGQVSLLPAGGMRSGAPARQAAQACGGTALVDMLEYPEQAAPTVEALLGDVVVCEYLRGGASGSGRRACGKARSPLCASCRPMDASPGPAASSRWERWTPAPRAPWPARASSTSCALRFASHPNSTRKLSRRSAKPRRRCVPPRPKACSSPSSWPSAEALRRRRRPRQSAPPMRSRPRAASSPMWSASASRRIRRSPRRAPTSTSLRRSWPSLRKRPKPVPCAPRSLKPRWCRFARRRRSCATDFRRPSSRLPPCASAIPIPRESWMLAAATWPRWTPPRTS